MEAALLWAEEESLRCSGCALPLDETTQPGRDQHYDAEAIVCHSCAARDRAQRAWSEKKGDTAGLMWRVVERHPVNGP